MEELQRTAAEAGIRFPAGLLDILQSSDPPSIEYFKTLPLGPPSCWGVYALTLERPGFRPRLYVGSGTSYGTPTAGGVALRFKQYDDGFLVPRFVKASLDHGFTITHKGLLCWMLRPAAAGVPVNRLFFLILEATFAYAFWAMKSRERDYSMGHVCFWNRHALDYDGCCTHCSLNEGVRASFDLNAQQLEDQAKEREQKRLILKAENNQSWHYRQMAENYAEYIEASKVRVYRSRANRPGQHAQYQANKITKALTEKTFHCDVCDIPFGTKQRLSDHQKTPKHLRKSEEGNNPFVCKPCNLGYHNKSNLTRHEKSARHQQNLAAWKENKP
ncbi:conserved hypothetical protein [Verticillium alfalfae VaMs.102]|uniref:C2H2-type domain-containing protein n=1 Tax=Verticillium alfalfae (strain VaMs.102 / ATCC MYA-4576 / FGSC 10136) TaxID=526221 RepID=C9SHV9_VERA1|nr:conserved hypothetical protein [Verticillium alfalfae VaMs.102]EEY18532.1 conserved hypothetical protein [Verticillium alfalfae VaMs.102]